MDDPLIQPGSQVDVRTAVDPDSISTVVQQVWSCMLGEDLGNRGESTAVGREERPVQGSVHIAGAWCGAISLLCSPEFARTVAAGMFGAEPDSLSTADIHDALGELVKVIGGNLKPLLPGPCRLSVPAVREVDNPGPAQPSAGLVTDVGFVCKKETFRVAVVADQAASDNQRAVHG